MAADATVWQSAVVVIDGPIPMSKPGWLVLAVQICQTAPDCDGQESGEDMDKL